MKRKLAVVLLLICGVLLVQSGCSGGKKQKAELEQAKTQVAEYLDQVQRVQAEFANYKKRIERERGEFVSLANAALISDLLPILDDLERALETVPENLQGRSWVEGILLIERRLRTTMEQEGVTEIEAVGEQFDPETMKIVDIEDRGDKEEGAVLAVYRRGYRWRGSLLQPAEVKVARRVSERGAGGDESD